MLEDELAKVEQGVVRLKALPPWRLYLLIAALLCVVGYLAWSLFGARTQTAVQGFQPGAPAVPAEKVDGPVVKTQIKIVPIEKVTEVYREFVGPPNTIVVDTAKIPPAKDGAVTVTSLNPETGVATTQVKINESPWFALERDNAIGAGYSAGSQGAKIPLYMRRSLVRIKDVHLLAEVGGTIALSPDEKSEGHVSALVEYRF